MSFLGREGGDTCRFLQTILLVEWKCHSSWRPSRSPVCCRPSRSPVCRDMANQGKLMKALRKDDDDAPRPELAPSAPTSDMGTLKLKKSSLMGTTSWEDVASKLEANGKHDWEVCWSTTVFAGG